MISLNIKGRMCIQGSEIQNAFVVILSTCYIHEHEEIIHVFCLLASIYICLRLIVP